MADVFSACHWMKLPASSPFPLPERPGYPSVWPLLRMIWRARLIFLPTASACWSGPGIACSFSCRERNGLTAWRICCAEPCRASGRAAFPAIRRRTPSFSGRKWNGTARNALWPPLRNCGVCWRDWKVLRTYARCCPAPNLCRMMYAARLPRVGDARSLIIMV